ncbi:MAG: DUF4249 domain-containing protein [Dysgonamonadaceae bacterium]|jgi:hypothetical protein|nr:DUF4249 domain-containing protein [Dysgonamonadaceae bacterium]
MKHSITIAWISLCLLTVISCNEDSEIAYIEYQPQIVVEGRIENGGKAIVLLSWSASFRHELDTAYLLGQIIRSAKVSVSDGEQTELLTLGVDNRYLPPYIYYGRTITGEVGKTYSLKIEYRGKTLRAETHIPKPVPLESCRFIKDSPDDSIGHVHIRFGNTSEEYYQIATRVMIRENIFTPCLHGNLSSLQFGKNETVSLRIHKGPILYPEEQFETYFTVGSWIEVEFRTQSREGYDFWNSWQNEVLNAQNPIFPAYTSLKSNIQGGIGIWCGYGVYNYLIQAK